MLKLGSILLLHSILTLTLFLTQWARAESLDKDKPVSTADSCACPKLTCNEECEVQKDLTFYSEKCADGSRVKSCSRPNCEKLVNAPSFCDSVKDSVKAGVKADGKVDAAAYVGVTQDSGQTPTGRGLASESEQGSSVGRVKFIEGDVKKILSPTYKVSVNVGDEIHEKNHIETEATGKAQIMFNNGNILNLTPNSEVIISEASDANVQSKKKRVAIDLLKGRIRNQVKHKYNDGQSYYRVRAGAAVAGVRGTDFVVSVVDNQKEIAAKVETLEGQVELSDSYFKEKISVKNGEAASYVADRSSAYGHFTSVAKLTDEQLADLEAATNYSFLEKHGDLKQNRNSRKDICLKPQGDLNQCAWSCENNPAGEKVCRTDLPQVSCVRRVCNANGEWSQPTRLPASYHEACLGDRLVVKSCDY